jgi:hypothetical protein
MLKSIVKLIIFAALSCNLTASAQLKALIFTGRHDKNTKKIAQVLKGYNCKVDTLQCSYKDVLAKSPKVSELIEYVKSADIIILHRNQEQFGYLAEKNQEFSQALNTFFSSGGVMLSLLKWIFSQDFKNYCNKSNIWYPDYNQIKAYAKHRSAYPWKFYKINNKISHPMLKKPHKLSGLVGLDNFGYALPKDKKLTAIAVRTNNPQSVGVVLQDNIMGNGTVISSCLYGFMGVGKKLPQNDNDPLAKHSMLFLKNMVEFSKNKKAQ